MTASQNNIAIASSAQGVNPALPDGASLIEHERRRQKNIEGYSDEHDDLHQDGALAVAAACYAHAAAQGIPDQRPEWPWENSDWKPSSDPVRNLVKAGALIAAEIDRLQREVAQ